MSDQFKKEELFDTKTDSSLESDSDMDLLTTSSSASGRESDESSEGVTIKEYDADVHSDYRPDNRQSRGVAIDNNVHACYYDLYKLKKVRFRVVSGASKDPSLSKKSSGMKYDLKDRKHYKKMFASRPKTSGNPNSVFKDDSSKIWRSVSDLYAKPVAIASAEASKSPTVDSVWGAPLVYSNRNPGLFPAAAAPFKIGPWFPLNASPQKAAATDPLIKVTSTISSGNPASTDLSMMPFRVPALPPSRTMAPFDPESLPELLFNSVRFNCAEAQDPENDAKPEHTGMDN